MGLFSILTDSVDAIEGSIKVGTDKLSTTWNKTKEVFKPESDAIKEFYNGKFADGVTWESFDLENPDGVHVNLRSKNILQSDAILNTDLSKLPKTSNQITQKNAIAQNLNQYYTDELDSITYTSTNKDGVETTTSVGKKPFSLFNRFSLVDYKGEPLKKAGGKVNLKTGNTNSKFYNKIDPDTIQNPTATKIIELTNTKDITGYRYDYSDFAMSKYFGRIPNNMMITLRRFAFPCPDDIISPFGVNPDGTKVSIAQPDIARAITFLGEQPGNNLNDILKFSHGFNWKTATAEVQTLQSLRGARAGTFGDKIQKSGILRSIANAANGRNAYDDAIARSSAGYDAFANTYPNHVFGPLNVIKEVLVREQGLTFDQEFTLKFEYELRSLGGANPKILMLDQLANILALTYNNAPFWGGEVRYIQDGTVARPLGDLNQLRKGNYGSWVKSIFGGKADGFKDLFTLDGLSDGIEKIFSVGAKAFNNIIGGALMERFNAPQGGQVAASLLTGDPTGQWHLTIGNPLNPIMVMGNLVCTNTEISFDGAMGVQDFPEKMIVTITLKPGRARDKADIESMFNAGRGRFYIQPADSINIDNDVNLSAYGNKDRIKTINKYKSYKKIGLG